MIKPGLIRDSLVLYYQLRNPHNLQQMLIRILKVARATTPESVLGRFYDKDAKAELTNFDTLAAFQPSRAASAATWPAREVTNVLRPVIADISENAPVAAALRFDVMRAAVV